MPNAMGAYSLLPWLRGLWTIDKRPASTPEPCDATHNLDTRRDHGPQDPRSSALAGILEPFGGRTGSKTNSVGGRTRGTGQTRLSTLRLDTRHHGEKNLTDRTPLGMRNRTRLQIGNTRTRGHDSTSFPDSTLRDRRGTRPTGEKTRTKGGNADATLRDATQLPPAPSRRRAATQYWRTARHVRLALP